MFRYPFSIAKITFIPPLFPTTLFVKSVSLPGRSRSTSSSGAQRNRKWRRNRQGIGRSTLVLLLISRTSENHKHHLIQPRRFTGLGCLLFTRRGPCPQVPLIKFKRVVTCICCQLLSQKGGSCKGVGCSGRGKMFEGVCRGRPRSTVLSF